MAAPDSPDTPEHRAGIAVRRSPGRSGGEAGLRDLHQDNSRRCGHGLQRPCRSRHRHPHRARADRRRRTRRVLCARRRRARRYLARSQSGRDHRQRNHPDHGGAAAQGRRAGAAIPDRARRGTARTAACKISTIEDGLIRGRDNRSVSYGELIGERNHPPRTRRRRRGQGGRCLQHRRPVGAARRPAGQGDRRTGLCPRRARARHAAWPRRAPALCRRRCRRLRRHQPDRGR